VNNKKLIETLIAIENWAKLILKNSYKARLYLESLHSPAPSRGKKKLSKAQVENIIVKRKLSRERQSKKKQS
jgi:hypothetical protein